MKCDKNLLNRLSRAEGQLRGITKMMEEGRPCEDVLTQLTAVRSSIDRLMRLVAIQNLMEHVDVTDQTKVESAVNLLTKV
ncbi:metal-sensing transcriptional repressor [Erysipelothrix sp. HDW6B]|uniref:metal-sensing transcriptional repressor n=1 Tax=Erysipelothrix TaxID=1647 RepID=UPI0013574B0D|nr:MULTISPECIES: metal-sensing transcriptional repressor [Erysipelothrix]QIK85692.1 metal-sensing transcriptional repressor [Erysipelothrix sp. HDW6B]